MKKRVFAVATKKPTALIFDPVQKRADIMITVLIKSISREFRKSVKKS